ncbi:hypothetical protein BJ508DRAFT_415290 [Ascobolus immersus RN42]|uniref:Uncharacterized protein n=1 Tax=Ascobolus immersus RN42 TaxID=1160509 RepID=A0A3N4I3D4_ASCIM|nr:hypothetical protein BJ508DRAFT_415290 [Ascobolus immersus RN42]
MRFALTIAAVSVLAGLTTALATPIHSVPYCPVCVASPNNCDITAPCAITLVPQTQAIKTFCACRAGYKATTSAIIDQDITKQWRLNNGGNPWEYRVFVAPGTKCDTLCDNWNGPTPCSEVRTFESC